MMIAPQTLRVVGLALVLALVPLFARFGRGRRRGRRDGDS